MAWGTQQWGQLPWGYQPCVLIVEHLPEVLALLPSKFKNSTNLHNLIKSYVGAATCDTWGFQELENELNFVMTDRWLATATGAQLDGLGGIVGEPRLGLGDDEYRDMLYTKVLINTSKGVAETLITILLRLSGGTLIHHMEKWPARVYMYAHAASKVLNFDKVQKAAGGGIAVTISASESDNPFVFGFDRDAAGNPHGEELPYGSGFGETNWPNEGGDFVQIFVP